MPNMLQTGLAWLADQQEEHVGTDIVYTRGAYTASLTVTTGKQMFRQQDTAGRLRVLWSDCDFFIRVEAMTDFFAMEADAKNREPQKGDRITAGTESYEVQAPGGEPCFRLCDDRQRYQIHTKRVA